MSNDTIEILKALSKETGLSILDVAREVILPQPAAPVVAPVTEPVAEVKPEPAPLPASTDERPRDKKGYLVDWQWKAASWSAKIPAGVETNGAYITTDCMGLDPAKIKHGDAATATNWMKRHGYVNVTGPKTSKLATHIYGHAYSRLVKPVRHS
jgi:hypothetical protein